MLCHNGDGSGQKKIIPCFGVREKNQFRKIVERFRCCAPWRQRKLVTEFRTRNCAERTLRNKCWSVIELARVLCTVTTRIFCGHFTVYPSHLQ